MDSVTSVSGLVEGTASSPYKVKLEFSGNTNIVTQCSCPYAHNCKHGVALMLAWIITLGDEDENEDEDPLAPEAAHGGAAPGGSPNRSQSGFSHDPYADEVRGWMADVVSAHTSSGAPRDAARRPTQTDSRWAYELWLSDDEVDLFTNMDVLANRVFFSIRKAKIQKNGGISKGSRYRAGQDYASLYDPSVTADLSWDRDDDLHVLELSIPLDTEWALIPTDPPYYLDLQTNRVGQITSTHSGQSLALALMAPPLTTQFAQELVELLETDDATETLQAPLPLPAVQRTHTVDVEPQPIIHVHSPEGDPHVAHWSLTLDAVSALPGSDRPKRRHEPSRLDSVGGPTRSHRDHTRT